MSYNPAVLASDINTGLGYYKSGEYSRAEAYFRNMLQEEPNNDKARYMLAITLVNLKKYNEAKQQYRNIVVSSNNTALVNLAQTGLGNLGETTSLSGKSGATRAVINVNFTGGSVIVRDVVLNDKLKTSFVLDTGASLTTISKATASQLGISSKGAKVIKIVTGSGYVNVPLVKIPKIEIQGLSATNVDAVILDLPVHKSGNSAEFAGLLGLSFLDRFKTTIDKTHGRVTLEKN